MVERRGFLIGIGVIFAMPAQAQEHSFQVGQIWTLRPPAHAAARVRIGRLDDNGAIVHISLWGMPAPIPQATDVIGSPLVVGHLPITAEALLASVDMRIDEQPPANLGFDEGYDTWRRANGGVFTLTVPEIVETIFQTVSNGEAAPANK
jgi:hypothetical protein